MEFYDSRALCLWSALKRVVAYWGRSRLDMPQGCPEWVDLEFLRFIWKVKETQRPGILAALEECGKSVHIFHTRRACTQFLKGVPACSSAF